MPFKCIKTFKLFVRKKIIGEDIFRTPLRKCLNTLDLIFVGIGNMMGAGIYIYTGLIAKSIAGPLSFISFIIASIISCFTALCYVELASIIPKAGSTYIYTYVIIGELVAFILGWYLIIFYVFTIAAIAKGWSATFALFFESSDNYWLKPDRLRLPDVFFLEEYPDFMTAVIIVCVTLVVLKGVKTNTFINNIIGVINIIFLTILVCICFYYSDRKNITEDILPFEIKGITSGATFAIIAYSGFDCISTASEEAIDAKRDVPRAMFICILILSILYTLASAALTFVIPYNLIDLSSPFPSALQHVGVKWGALYVSISSLITMTQSCLMHVYGVSRCTYAMANDGLIFKSLASVSDRTQTPLIAAIVTAFVSVVLAVFMKLTPIIESISLGILISFTLTPINVLFLRYKTLESWPANLRLYPEEDSVISSETNELIPMEIPKTQSIEDIGKLRKKFRNIPWMKDQNADNVTYSLITTLLIALVTFAIHISKFGYTLHTRNLFSIIIFLLEILLILAVIVVLTFFEQNKSIPSFQVPFVPFFPIISITINMLAAFQLSGSVWIIFTILGVFGLVIYFAYGIWNSKATDIEEDE